MLFHYAIEATEENWLHESICFVLTNGMDQIDVGAQPQGWPDCLPEEHRIRLSARTGIRDHSQKFFGKYVGYNAEQRQSIRRALTTQNALPEIFDGHSDRITLEELPADVKKVVNDLFGYAFGLLTDLDIRDRHYEAIYAGLPRKFCPFCGLERLSKPGQPRHDLDHYLLLSVYPFAGANLRNLVPMGDRCNKSFKRQVDVIFDVGANTRRRCCDPYSGPGFNPVLSESSLLDDDQAVSHQPTWYLAFAGGDEDRAATWDDTFQISRRYTDVLDEEYHRWLRAFANWCGDPRNTASITDTPSAVAALDHYIELIQFEGLDDSNFLKRAVFRMLRDQCANGPNAETIASWLLALLEGFALDQAA